MDDVVVAHRHGAELCEMRLVSDERVDHLAVKRYHCECGLNRAILEHVDDVQQQSVMAWPYPRGARRDGTTERRIVG